MSFVIPSFIGFQKNPIDPSLFMILNPNNLCFLSVSRETFNIIFLCYLLQNFGLYRLSIIVLMYLVLFHSVLFFKSFAL